MVTSAVYLQSRPVVDGIFIFMKEAKRPANQWNWKGMEKERGREERWEDYKIIFRNGSFKILLVDADFTQIIISVGGCSEEKDKRGAREAQ